MREVPLHPCSRANVARGELVPVLTDSRVHGYRVTSLIIKRLPLGPYCRPIPRALWCSYRGGLFLVSEVPLNMIGGAA